jgi:formate hydrogenlyase subunit 4
VVAVVKLVVGVLVIALFENSMARLRFVPPPASPGPVLVFF